MPRRRRPALGQLTFAFVTAWLPQEIEPPAPPRPPPAPPPPLPSFWWRARRKAANRPVARAADRDERTISRWVNRGVGCALCRS
jgi:hypothetical protein